MKNIITLFALFFAVQAGFAQVYVEETFPQGALPAGWSAIDGDAEPNVFDQFAFGNNGTWGPIEEFAFFTQTEDGLWSTSSHVDTTTASSDWLLTSQYTIQPDSRLNSIMPTSFDSIGIRILATTTASPDTSDFNIVLFDGIVADVDEIDLSAYDGQDLSFAYHHVSVNQGLVGIVLFELRAIPALDAVASGITTPQANGCALGNAEIISMGFQNEGTTDTIFSIDAHYNVIDGFTGNVVSSSNPETFNFPSGVLPGDSASITFSAGADLSAEGAWFIQAIVNQTNDGDNSNDSTGFALSISNEPEDIVNNGYETNFNDDFINQNSYLFEENEVPNTVHGYFDVGQGFVLPIIEGATNWLISPCMDFSDATLSYVVSAELIGGSLFVDGSGQTDIEFYLGNDRNGASMTTLIGTAEDVDTNSREEQFVFTVPSAGTYYLGFKTGGNDNVNPAAFIDHTVEAVDCGALAASTTAEETAAGTSNGSASVANVTGGYDNYSYSWAHDGNLTGPDATGLMPGDYDLTITDDLTGCELAITITVPTADCSNLSVTMDITDETDGAGNGSITTSVTGATGAIAYAWDHDGNLTVGNIATLAAGDYTVTVTDARGCTASTTGTVSNVTNILDATVIGLNIYPNPATEYITVEFNNTVLDMTITAVDGKVIARQSLTETTTINTSAFANGTYVITLTNEEGTTSSQFTVAK